MYSYSSLLNIVLSCKLEPDTKKKTNKQRNHIVSQNLDNNRY